jgi:hypothetical protein
MAKQRSSFKPPDGFVEVTNIDGSTSWVRGDPAILKMRAESQARVKAKQEAAKSAAGNASDGKGEKKTPPLLFRPAPPWRPFPLEALPDVLREYVDASAAAMGCDPAFVALPVLATVASTIGATRTVKLKRGWEEPSVLWSMVVADSGTLKSPAYLRAVTRLLRVQAKYLEEYKAALAAHDKAVEEYDQAVKAFANGDGPDPGEPPQKPTLRRVIVSDITVEKLADILEANPRGILAARDELAGWLGSFSRYKGKGAASDLPLWLEMHRAGALIVDRKTGPKTHYYVPRAAVCVTGGVQPGVLSRALTEEFFESGLVARVVMAMPPRTTKKWTEAEVAESLEARYHDLLDRLLALGFARSKDGERLPYPVQLGTEAKYLWVQFYKAWAAEQAASEGSFAAALAKLEGGAARLALVHHLCARVSRGEDDLLLIKPESMEAGITLARWFADEARRIYACLAESREEGECRRLVEWIAGRGGRVTVRELHRSNQRKYRDADDARAALDRLVEAGLGTWHDQRHFDLCVTGDTCDNPPPADDADDEEPADACVTIPPTPAENSQKTPGAGATVTPVTCHTQARKPVADGKHETNGSAVSAPTVTQAGPDDDIDRPDDGEQGLDPYEAEERAAIEAEAAAAERKFLERREAEGSDADLGQPFPTPFDDDTLAL